jgi:hypothetical protein
VVRVHPDPPLFQEILGALAQLGEHLLCKQGVVGSIPTGSTILILERTVSAREITSTPKII